MANARIQQGLSLSQSLDGQKVPVHLITSSSASATGLTSPTIVASKSGASNASLSDGTWAEIGNGVYTVKLNSTDTDTLGWIAITITHGSAEDAVVLCEVSINSNEKRSSYIRQRATYRG